MVVAVILCDGDPDDVYHDDDETVMTVLVMAMMVVILTKDCSSDADGFDWMFAADGISVRSGWYPEALEPAVFDQLSLLPGTFADALRRLQRLRVHVFFGLLLISSAAATAKPR